ncbi:24441_t:CDS:2, partial [Gigaspora margarita]
EHLIGRPLLQFLLQRDALSTINSIDAESVFDYYVQKMPNCSFQKICDALGKDLEEALEFHLFNEQITRVLRNIKDNWNIWKTQLQHRNHEKTFNKQKNFRKVRKRVLQKYQKSIAKVTDAEVDEWANETVNVDINTIHDESEEKGKPKWVLRKRKPVDYYESSSSVSDSDLEYQKYQEESKKIVQIKMNKEINEISSSSRAKSSRPIAPDLVINNDGIERIRMSDMDYNNFTKAFQELDDRKNGLCHSFIIDPDDKSLIEEKVFTEFELMQIRTHKLKLHSDMPQDLLGYLGSYQLSWKASYDRQKDFDRDRIRNTIDNLQAKKEDHLEVWLLSHIWLFVDGLFENIDVQAIRHGTLLIILVQ